LVAERADESTASEGFEAGRGANAESLKRVAEYGAAKNVVVNMENDNPKSEDPFSW